jgi:hypothetical protein
MIRAEGHGRRLALALVAAIMVGGAMLPALARAATGGVGGGDTGFGTVVVDDSDQAVFVSYPKVNEVIEYNYQAQVLAVIPNVYGAWGMTIDGNYLYIAENTAGAIVRVDLTDNTLTPATVATGLVGPEWLVMSGGQLWTTRDVNSGQSDLVVSVDPTTGAVTGQLPGTFYEPDLAVSAADPNALFVAGDGLSPGSVYRFDVSTNPATQVVQARTDTDNIEQLAVTSDGGHVIVAAGAPYYFEELDANTLQPDGIRYPGAAYPSAVTSSGSGLVATALSAGSPDVCVYNPGQPAAIWSGTTYYHTDSIPPHGLAMSADGSTVFAMSRRWVSSSTANYYTYALDALSVSHSLSPTACDGQQSGSGSSSGPLPPVITETLGASSIPLGGTTTMTFTITNPNTTTTLTGVGFNDTLPDDLVFPSGAAAIDYSGCSGGLSLNGATLSETGASLPPDGGCTIVVTVIAAEAGSIHDIGGSVTSDQGTGNSPSAWIDAEEPPAVITAFTPTSIAPGGTSTLTMNLYNAQANPEPQSDVEISEQLPPNLAVATPSNLSTSCEGSVTALPGSGTVRLTGGSMPVSSSCAISVDVTGTTTGTYLASSTPISSANGGVGGTSDSTLTVAEPPTITTSFRPTAAPLGSTVQARFTVLNPNRESSPSNEGVTLTGVSFRDELPAGLTIVQPIHASTDCGGTLTEFGPQVLYFSGGQIEPRSGTVGGECHLWVELRTTATGEVSNTTDPVGASQSGPGAGSNTALMTVEGPVLAPAVATAFAQAWVLRGGQTRLTFTVRNLNRDTSLANVEFEDFLPHGLQDARQSAAGSCIRQLGGTVTSGLGWPSATVSIPLLKPMTACSISLGVLASEPGSDSNQITVVNAEYNDGSGNMVSVRGHPGAADLEVLKRARLGWSFATASLAPGAVTGLTFRIANPNAATGLGVAFRYRLAAGLVLADPSATGSCIAADGASITANPGWRSLRARDIQLSVLGSCAVTVQVLNAAATPSHPSGGSVHLSSFG